MTDDRRPDHPRDDDAGLVIGPTSGDADVTVQPRGRVARGATHRDAEIARDVSRRLGEHASLDASGVDVRVKDGRVTLEGRVQDPPARHVAELIADAVPGVRGVENRLETSRG
jgi:osmotically-inducible protein OsmY